MKWGPSLDSISVLYRSSQYFLFYPYLQRAAGLLARALPHSTEAVQGACESGTPLTLLQALQVRNAVGALADCFPQDF